MIRVLDIAYHRNGVGGNPFYVALVEDTFDDYPDEPTRNLVVIVPTQAVDEGSRSRTTPGGYESYAIDPELAATGDVKFGSNSWRGDHYFETVVEAARAKEAAAEHELNELVARNEGGNR